MDSDLHTETVSAKPYTPVATSIETVAATTAPDYGPPATQSGALLLLTGLDSATVLVLPALCGAALGWWSAGSLSLIGTCLLLFSHLCLFIGLQIFSEFNDYRFGLRPESKYYDETSFPGTNLISAGLFHPGFVISAGGLFLVAGVLGILILSFTIAGWPTLFFFAIMGILLAFYLLPPPWHGYLSWGLGEVGLFIAVGIVQAVSGYYVQQEMVDTRSLFFGVPLGFFAVLVLFSRNLIRQRRDWMIRKRTFAVALGDQRSVYFFIAIIVAAYASLLLVVTLTSLPLLLLLGLATLPLAIGRFKRAEEILQTPDDRYHLHRVMLKVTGYTCLLIIALLVLEKLT